MEFLEVPLFDDDIYKLLVRFAIDLFFLTFIVRFAIYPSQRETEFAFTAVMMNVTVFFICFTMKKLDIGIGMVLGLFAIFGVLRFRTDTIRTKEMTYLFIVIGIAVINALSNKSTSYAELALVNSLIFSAAILKERIVLRHQQLTKNKSPSKGKEASVGKVAKCSMEYDKLEWLGEGHRDDLLTDLRQRTGMDIVKVQIQNIDLARTAATLTIWFNEPTPSTKTNSQNGTEADQ